MDHGLLEETVKSLLVEGKGLLAADESAVTCEKRFEAVGIPCTEATRRAYRELLLTTPGAEQFVSGVIMFDETFWQATAKGQLFREYLKNAAIQPGIKVDKGLIELPGFPGEKLSQGLDSLPDELKAYAGAGARFAKWRSVIAIGDGLPTDECIGANTFVLSRYARICQENGIVPLVEPEVLFNGMHSSDDCERVIARTCDILFQTLRAFRVHLPGVILKTSMVLPGKESGVAINYDDVAERTARVLTGHVPPEAGGIVFLSGGQTSKDAFINLNRIIRKGGYPWPITFSYSRALQDPVLKAWAHDRTDTKTAQQLFLSQLQMASAASHGALNEAMLDDDAFVSHSQDL